MGNLQDSDFLYHLRTAIDSDGKLSGPADIYEYFPSIIYVVDVDTKKVNYINKKRFSNALGYSQQDLIDADNDILQLIFKDDFEKVQEELEIFRNLADQTDHSFQCRFNLKEGEYRYFRSRGTVLRRNASGDPQSILFTAEDITDQVKSEQEVLALQSLVNDTEKLLDFGSWNWDLTTDQVQWSEGIIDLFGYDKKLAENSSSFSFFLRQVKPEDRVKVERAFQEAIKNKQDLEVSYSIVTDKNIEKIVLSKGKIVKDDEGNVKKVVGITSDITEQIKLNRDLVYYKEMMLEKEEFLNQGSWEWHVAEKKISWSQGMYGLFGYDIESKPEIDHLAELSQLIFSDEERKHWETDPEKLPVRDTSFTHETTIVTPEGSRKQVETYSKSIRNTEGEIEKIIGTSRDVTPIRKYERSLEEKINELNRSNKELEEFAYIASHDLQEPLRKLTTFSERLLSKFSDRLGPDGIVYLERIGAATENMRVLIENLLEFSRTARSNSMYSVEDLSVLLNKVKADLELKIEETGTQIIAEPLPEMEVIRSQIKQLFDNLLSNSIKFRKRDEPCVVSITCAALDQHEKDELHLPIDKNYFKIAFKDNGIGFEKEYSERIFQIFQRLHGKSEYPGSGIGLAICKKIVENHGGLIYADSNPEEGAEFTVILPEKQT